MQAWSVLLAGQGAGGGWHDAGAALAAMTRQLLGQLAELMEQWEGLLQLVEGPTGGAMAIATPVAGAADWSGRLAGGSGSKASPVSESAGCNGGPAGGGGAMGSGDAGSA